MTQIIRCNDSFRCHYNTYKRKDKRREQEILFDLKIPSRPNGSKYPFGMSIIIKSHSISYILSRRLCRASLQRSLPSSVADSNTEKPKATKARPQRFPITVSVELAIKGAALDLVCHQKYFLSFRQDLVTTKFQILLLQFHYKYSSNVIRQDRNEYNTLPFYSQESPLIQTTNNKFPLRNVNK